MNYRPDIDGLRALAVLPVIFYHAGFTTFSGGFVGVDIFFVISGYLITNIVVYDLDKQKFSLVNFYERRARRILPALFFMMLCTLPFAWVFMLPQHLKGFSQSIAATPLFASNILFYLTSDYFDTASELKPLMHTWSLAVEEQYYVFFPIFLILFWKLGKKFIIFILILVALTSLVSAHWNSTHHPYFNFFLLPTRIFEIIIGSLISFCNYRSNNILPQNHLINQTLSFTGLFLILFAIFTFNSKTPTPSLYSLIPTLGAALIILFTNKSNYVGMFLGSKLLVGIGLISYSTYLWHQPLFAFYRIQNLYQPTSFALFILCFGSIILGYLSWLFIERPFRNKYFIRQSSIFKLSFSFSIFFIFLGLFGYLQDGFRHIYVSNLNSNQKQIYTFIDMNIDNIWRQGTCSLTPNQTFNHFSIECLDINKKQDSILLWGDSHAASLSNGLRGIHGNVAQLTASACPPLLDTFFIIRPNCKLINDYVLKQIGIVKPTKVFLLANWRSYFGDYDVINLLENTIAKIKSTSPNTEIAVIGSLPQYEVSIPELMFQRNMHLNKIYYITLPFYHELLFIDKNLLELSLKNDIQFKSALDIFCKKDVCQITAILNGEYEPTPYDLHHLSKAGSFYLANGLLKN